MRKTVVQISVENGIISDEEQIYLVWMFAVIYIVLGVAGVVTSVISLRTFLKMGLDDGVSISFFALTLSDLIYVICTMAMGMFSIFWAMEMESGYQVWFHLDPFGGYTIAANVSFLLYVMSMLTTVYLAIARCLCVAKPFHFKDTFTKNRSLVIIGVFVVFSIATYVPVLAQMGMDSKLDNRVNATRLLLWITTEREFIKVIVWAARDTFISIASQVIVMACVVIMATVLRKSQEFRKKFTTVTTLKATSSSDDVSQAPEVKASRKDNVLVKQILLICMVYIVCNIPKVVLNIAVALVPELTIGKRYQNLSQAGVNIMSSTQMLHACFNFIVYYKFNAKFKNNCFGRKK